MAQAAGGFIIDPNGNQVTINLTQAAGLSITVYSDAALTSSVTLPVTTSSSQALYVDDSDTYTLSVKYNGVEMAGGLGSSLSQYVSGGGVSVLRPVQSLSTSYNYGPGDHGFLAWSCPVEAASGTYQLATAGTIYLSRVHLPTAATITNLHVHVTTAGGTLTSGQCFAALYDVAAITKRGTTATQHTAWESVGAKTMALSAAYAASAGDYYVALWYNGTTAPTFARTGNNTVATLTNTGYSTKFKAATADTGQTTAGPTTLGTQTSFKEQIWVALS